MRKSIVIATIVTIIAVFVSMVPSAFADQALLSNMSLFAQEQSNWCWAAVTQTVAAKNNAPKEAQCRMASRFIRGQTGDYCCHSSTASSYECNRPYYLSESMSHYGVLDRQLGGQLDQARLVTEIRSGYPVVFSVFWSGGGGHALLFYGAVNYSTTDEKGERETIRTVHIWDPANGGDKVVMSRSRAESYRGGTWDGTFTTKCPNNSCGA